MFLQQLTSTLSLLLKPEKKMSSEYDIPLNKDTNFTPAKPFSFKKTISAKDKLRKLSRLVKATSSFKLPMGITTKWGDGRKTASSSRRNRSVRVSGVDFEIVSMPTSGSSEWPLVPEEESSVEDEDYGVLLPSSPLRHLLSTYSLVENYLENITCDSFQVQELRRKQSLETQFRQFEEHWNQGPHFDELQRPGSIYDTSYSMVDLEEMTKERVYFLTPGDTFISEDILKFGKPFKQSIVDEGFPIELDREHPIPSIIKRKPVPLF